ncbi:glycosyltransferase [Alteromonadaceae bacterium M269]|nr:glycosyltransferase [Alteromonadaceae bacterium M269]
MEKIALITERVQGGVENGSTLRDKNLLHSLIKNYSVDVFYNDVSQYGRWGIFRFNAMPSPEVVKALKDSKYRYIIVSTFPVSPCYLSYSNINPKVIHYLCDSTFHMLKQNLGLKIKILTLFLAFKELLLARSNKVAFLGDDEVNSMPFKLARNSLVFPFYVQKKKKLFRKDGFVTFVGDYAFPPNLAALEKIIEIADKSTLLFRLFGANFPNHISLPENVKYEGYVEDISHVYFGARALIYPIKYGTGVKNKVIEAMSFGIPVIGFKEAFTNITLTGSLLDCIALSLESFPTLLSCDLSVYSNEVIRVLDEQFSEEEVSNRIKKALETCN